MIRRCSLSQLSLLLCCVTGAIIEEVVEGNKTKSWTLHHRLLAPGSSSATSNSDWSIRGTVELTIVDPVPAGVAELPDSSVTLVLSNGENSLTEELAQALTSTSGWYQLQLMEDGKQQSPDEIVLTSVPACHVRRANFRDEFVLQLQQNTAKVLSLTYMPLISPLAPATCDEYNQSQHSPDSVPTFESKISWESNVPGMVVGKPPPPTDPLQPQGFGPSHNKVTPPPPGLRWIPGASRKPTGAGGGLGADPEHPPTENGPFGFAKRYWYILLPLMLVNLLGAGETPAPAAAGAPGAVAASRAAGGVAATPAAVVGARAATVVAATPAVTGATATSPGSPPVRRRGKKGGVVT